jgi:hypothetical protein
MMQARHECDGSEHCLPLAILRGLSVRRTRYRMHHTCAGDLNQSEREVTNCPLKRRQVWASVGESTAYRVSSDVNPLLRWKRPVVLSGEYHFRPTAPNQQWHTDVTYVWVAARFYFLVGFVDAYGRFILHHKLARTVNRWRPSCRQRPKRRLMLNHESSTIIEVTSSIAMSRRSSRRTA